MRKSLFMRHAEILCQSDGNGYKGNGFVDDADPGLDETVINDERDGDAGADDTGGLRLFCPE